MKLADGLLDLLRASLAAARSASRREPFSTVASNSRRSSSGVGGQITAIEMQHVEGVVDDGVGRLMVEGLEGWTPLLVYRHYLTVKEHGLSAKPRDFSCDGRIQLRRVFQVAREELDPLAILQCERPVSVQFDLVGPVRTFGSCVAELANMGGRVRRGTRRAV